jgi:sporulation protein YlmC with PRC-barrel domain
VRLVSSRELRGKTVFSQDGMQLGVVESLELSPDTWRVLGFDVKLRREVLSDMKLKRPMMGSQTVAIAPTAISGIGDAIILKARIADVPHTGGKPA